MLVPPVLVPVILTGTNPEEVPIFTPATAPLAPAEPPLALCCKNCEFILVILPRNSKIPELLLSVCKLAELLRFMAFNMILPLACSKIVVTPLNT